MDSSLSTASSMVLNAKCPTIGKAYAWFAPAGSKAPTNDATSVTTAHGAFDPMAKDLHTLHQWRFFAVTDVAALTALTFSTKTASNYTGMLYCQSTEKFWYPSKVEDYSFLSPDNGGSVVKITFTWGKAFSSIDNNDLLN
jgi:hypothetical protein